MKPSAMKASLCLLKTFCLILFTVLFCFRTQAQSSFVRIYDLDPSTTEETGYFRTIIQTSDGGYFAHLTINNPFGPDVSAHLVAKLDADGTIIWRDTTGYVICDNLTELPDGTLAAVGWGYNDVTETYLTHIIKYTPAGAILSEMDVVPDLVDFVLPYTLRFTDDGGFVMDVVNDWDHGADANDISLNKYSAAGDLEWSQLFPDDTVSIYYPDKTFILEDGYLFVSNETYNDYAADPVERTKWTRLAKVSESGVLEFDEEMRDLYIADISVLPSGDFVSLLAEPYTEDIFWPENLNMILQKRNSDGDILWEKEYPELANYRYNRIFTMASGDLAVLCSTNFDEMTMNGTITMMYFDSEGNFIESKEIEDGNVYQAWYADKTADNGFVLAGSYTLVPDIVGRGLIMKLDSLANTDRVTLHGKVYYDMNENLVYDDEDVVLPSQLIEIMDAGVYAGTNSEGDFTTWIYSPGTYNIKSYNADSLYQTSPVTDYYTLTVDSLTELFDTLYFAKGSDGVLSNLQLDIEGWTATPGFTMNYTITVTNNNVLPAEDIHLKLVHDPVYTFENASPYYANYTDDTLTWNIPALAGFSTTNIHLFLSIPPDTSLLGETLHSFGEVSNATAETDLADNLDTLDAEVVSSFDPNAKTVEPKGYTEFGYVDPATDHLTYKIDFQNLGNDSATFISIYDTLAPEIEFTSFKMISSSHNYDVDFIYPNIVKWNFNAINLPPAVFNEAESLGFVKFEADLKPGLPEGTQIKNLAAIYFDYNPAVMTNYAYTTLKIYIPDFVVQEETMKDLILYPNPAQTSIEFKNLQQGTFDVLVYDNAGRLLLKQAVTTAQQSINIAALPAGDYIFELRSAEKIYGNGKFIVVK